MYISETLMKKSVDVFDNKVLPKREFVLDTAAGTGRDLQLLKNSYGRLYGSEPEGIEDDPINRKKLQENKVRVVHSDFLAFRTFQQYKIIILKFSGEADLIPHLQKALEMQKDGGGILYFIPESIYFQPASKEEHQFVDLLEKYNAEVLRDPDCMENLEEIVSVVITIPGREYKSTIYSKIANEYIKDIGRKQEETVTSTDYLFAATKKYEMEVRAGIQFIQEYKGLSKHIMNSLLDERYKKPMIKISIGDHNEETVNSYIAEVRRKYWEALFKNPKFVGNMTSNLLDNYRKDIERISQYDFTLDNIRPLQAEISKKLIHGIEECILKLFDEMTYQNAWRPEETANNASRYNGWKTNKCWIINQKVIMWLNAFRNYGGGFYPDYRVCERIEDMEKSLNYLDGKIAYKSGEVRQILEQAKETGQTKNIQFRFFKVNFYKKGSMHVFFTDLELLKRLNIFGGRKKAWLPPAYGEKPYQEMSQEERAVVDAFQGAKDYRIIYENKESYIWTAERLELPLLGVA